MYEKRDIGGMGASRIRPGEIRDARWLARLVSVAAQAARRPAGKVTEVLGNNAARQGAYGLLESEDATGEQVGASMFEACAKRCEHEDFVFCPMTLDFRDKKTKKHFPKQVNVVLAREQGTTPTGEKPIEWLLLTNRSIATEQDIKQVVFGYAQRWRMEDFHRTWKSGTCRVEESQLRSEALIKWATILAVTIGRYFTRALAGIREQLDDPHASWPREKPKRKMQFSPAFKAQIARRVRQGDLSITRIACMTKGPVTNIRAWLKRATPEQDAQGQLAAA